MKKNFRTTILSIFTSLAMITGCHPINQNTGISSDFLSAHSSLPTLHSSATMVRGTVDFPSSNPFSPLTTDYSPFTTKALLSDIAPSATVSILYPSDHPTFPNVTVATGLTDESGNFTINPSSTFNPAVNSVYILEASKRIGDSGNDNMALRTYIKWKGSGWDSMTTPGIFINTRTTALAIIQNNKNSTVSALQTIGKITISGGTSIPQNIGESPVLIDSQTVIDVAGLVTNVLFNNHDPMEYIRFVNEEFTILDPPSINIIYLNSNATGSNNGTNWANAYTSLQDALSAATSGKDIWIATGTYKPGTLVTDTFQLKSGVKIYGGFAGTETQLSQRNFNTNIVTLSGDLNNNSYADDGDSYNVLTGVTGAILDGVTVKLGFANGTGNDIYGGGMYNNNSSPVLTNVTFSNNSANQNGGGMYNNNSSPVLTNVTFSNNSTIDGYGGGVFNINNSSPTLTNVTFTSNSANVYGGGMYNDSSSPTLTNVTFSDNSSMTSGGGVYNYNSSPTLTNVTFTSNSAISSGGGVYNYNSSPVLTNVTFTSNSANYGYGGGVYNYNSSPTLTNVTFTSNSAIDGGGLINWTSLPTLTNVTFSGNTATNGGGVYNYNSSPTLTNVTFSDNSASTNGGGVYNDSSSPTLTKITFSYNSANDGGGVYNDSSSPTLTNVTFSNNSAISSGGGMYNTYNSSSPTLTNVTFSGNTANYGGGISNNSSSPALTNVTFSNNSASTNGGGVYNDSSSLILTNVTFSNNSAISSGGGMCNNNSSLTVIDTIFWGNTAADGNSINKPGSILKIGYSDVEGGFTGITGGTGQLDVTIKDMTGTTTLDATKFSTVGHNIEADPLFLNASDLDGADNILRTLDDGLALQGGSPAKNTGTYLGAANKDIAGVTRPKGAGIDMGAYEYVE